jgi:hypothetical protein
MVGHFAVSKLAWDNRSVQCTMYFTSSHTPHAVGGAYLLPSLSAFVSMVRADNLLIRRLFFLCNTLYLTTPTASAKDVS